MGEGRGTIQAPTSAHTGGRAAHRRRRKRGRWLALTIALLVAAGLVLAFVRPFGGGSAHRQAGHPPPSADHVAPLDSHGRPYRPFENRSWWNTPVPANAPSNPLSAQILNYMSTAPESGHGCLRLAGAQHNKWGQPAYWAQPGDPVYDVQGLPAGAPRQMKHLRIPLGAQGADNSDGTMTVYDVARGYVVLMTDAHYDAETDTWSASGATVTYMDSNGLSAATGRSDDPRNTGTHRGNNGATSYVRYDMVQAGAVRNVLKVASGPELLDRAVFPMTGSDGGYHGHDPAVPPEGLRLRIKPSVNLESLGLTAQALTIARALQRYGFYIGDSGGTTALKLENTRAEGRGQLWNLSADALCGLPFTPTYWDVVDEGYDPTR